MNDESETSELIAYLDGELPAGRREAIERRIAGDSELRGRLRSLSALTKRSRASIRASTPAASDDLRSRILAIAEAHDASSDLVSARPRLNIEPRPPRPWFRRLAVAACVALASGAAIWLVTREPTATRVASTPPRQTVQGRQASGLTVETVSLLEARHIKCVMMGNNFEDPTFPRQLADIGPSVRQYLGDDVEIPDLTGIGLTFVGVGPCDIPGGKTLHWLYIGKEATSTAVSVFVQPFTGQVTIGTDQAVVVAGPTANHPILVWRSDKFVYYLIGDDFGATSRVAERMAVSFGR